MKEVRINSGLAGKEFTFPAGSIQTVTDEKAEELSRKGLAVIVGEVKNTSSRKAADRRTASASPSTPPKPIEQAPQKEPEQEETVKPVQKPAGKKRGRKPKNSN